MGGFNLQELMSKAKSQYETLQKKMLETVVEVAAEKNSTLVLPFPVELLRFFDRASRVPAAVQPAAAATDAPASSATHPTRGGPNASLSPCLPSLCSLTASLRYAPPRCPWPER